MGRGGRRLRRDEGKEGRSGAVSKHLAGPGLARPAAGAPSAPPGPAAAPARGPGPTGGGVCGGRPGPGLSFPAAALTGVAPCLPVPQPVR